MTAFYNTGWFGGSIPAAAITLGTSFMNSNWSWRIPSVIQAAPSILQIMFIWFVPESPRFLMSKGKNEEALKVLAHYHADGNVYVFFLLRLSSDFTDSMISVTIPWSAMSTRRSRPTASSNARTLTLRTGSCSIRRILTAPTSVSSPRSGLSSQE